MQTQALTEQSQSRNEQETLSPRTEQFLSPETCVHLTFSMYARSLECPETLQLVAADRKSRMIERCKEALHQWKEAGYPDLGDWPVRGTELLDHAYQRMLKSSATVQI